MNARIVTLFLLLVVSLLALTGSLYVVRETERAVVLRFGALIDVDSKPGLHVKIPFVDEVRKFDARVLTLDAPAESFYTLEKKRLIVNSFSKWRIDDVETYYRATGGDEKLMTDLIEELNAAVKQSLGIEVIDVRVKKIDLPEEVSEAVFNRMSAEREKLAREYRSQGKEQAEKIRADADRQVTIMEAEAYRDAELARGEGDAEASAIYAAAFDKDREFYSFTRSLKAYESAFSGPEDVLVLDPKSDFFRYLNESGGRR
jgi:membrane protease subunit HflC